MYSLKDNKFRIIGLIVVVILGVVLFNHMRYSGLQKIQSDEDKFSMYVPEEWTVEYADPTPEIDISGAFAYDDSKENFIFVIVSPTQENNYEDDLNNWQKQFEIVNFKFLKSEISKMNGYEAARYEASVTNGEIPYFQKGFVTYHNGNKYQVLAQCREDAKDEMVEVFDKSLKTFKLK